MKELNLKIRRLLEQDVPTNAIVDHLGCDVKAVYRQRHLLNKAKKKKGKVRAYVRRVPKHPDQTQIVEAYERTVRTPEDKLFKPDGEPKAFVAPRSLDRAAEITASQKAVDQFVADALGRRLDEAIAKNYELVEEIRRLDTVIQYLEAKISRMMK